jgi:hypothetical protein
MADRRSVKKQLKRLEYIRTWQLVLLVVLSLFVTVTFLRLNSVGMIELRDAVVAADKAGDTDNTADALYDLQRYSAQHMNAASGDVYLVEIYNRDVEKAMKDALAQNSTENNVLQLADAACRPRFYTYSQEYTLCVRDEQAKYPEATSPSDEVVFPDPSLYKHSFISPLWSPDFAGWSLVVSLLLIVLLVGRILYAVVLRLLLRREYRSV